MLKSQPAANPDEYVNGLGGWQRERVERLRAAVGSASPLTETVKWGHLVYFANGPAVLIRAEEARVLLGFWRGQRLQSLEPRLKPGGKYEMARLDIVETTSIESATVVLLAKQAVWLNATLGDPTKAAKSPIVL